jgi:hypothetical protein
MWEGDKSERAGGERREGGKLPRERVRESRDIDRPAIALPPHSATRSQDAIPLRASWPAISLNLSLSLSLSRSRSPVRLRAR